MMNQIEIPKNRIFSYNFLELFLSQKRDNLVRMSAWIMATIHFAYPYDIQA